MKLTTWMVAWVVLGLMGLMALEAVRGVERSLKRVFERR